LAFELSI